MAKKRATPSEVARAGSGNIHWFDRLIRKDQAWINKLIEEIATVEAPAYHSIALNVIELINLTAHENTIVRFLKQKVKQCHEKNQAK